uniref:GmrSD restriction endonuclease domain-containing protein n=1 Tax=Eubacterium sp. TaxID=142586 RepID=UPI004029FFDB
TIQLNIPDKNKKYYEIIDGQQRITTIVLLIDFLEKANKKIINKNIDLVYENIQTANKTLSNIKNDEINEIESDSTYLQNRKTIKKLFSAYAKENNLKSDELADRLSKSINKLLFIELSTNNMELSSIISLFHTINTTGLDLNSQDLFKLQYYQHLSETKGKIYDASVIMNNINKNYEKVNNYNNKNKNKISIQNIIDVYKHIIVAKNDLKWEMLSKSNESFFEEILKRKDIDWLLTDRNGFESVLEIYIDLHNFIVKKIETKNISSITDEKNYSSLKYFSEYLIDTTRYSLYRTIPYVIAFFCAENDCNNNESIYEFALEKALDVYKYLLVNSVNYDRYVYRVQKYICSKVLTEIANNKNIPDDLLENTKKWPESEIDCIQNFNDRLKYNLYDNAKRSDMICRLSDALEEINNNSDLNRIKELLFNWDEHKYDKEHIFARKFWKDEILSNELGWTSDDKYIEELNGIGNLVILERSINRSAKVSDKEFIKKKEGYKSSQYASVKSIVNDTDKQANSDKSHWDKKDVEERAENQIKLLDVFLFGENKQ